MSCTYCLKTGHIEDDCYRLIGYSEDFQFTKGFPSPIKGNAAIKEEDYDNLNTETDDSDDHFLTQLSRTQISQIEQIVKQGQHHPTSSNHSQINANVVAGTITKYSDSCFSIYNSKTWIKDSGASKHMCFDSHSFLDLTPLSISVTINLPNSYIIKDTHTGRIKILPHLTL